MYIIIYTYFYITYKYLIYINQSKLEQDAIRVHY